jgi:acyl-CoA thioester hydrolase
MDGVEVVWPEVVGGEKLGLDWASFNSSQTPGLGGALSGSPKIAKGEATLFCLTMAGHVSKQPSFTTAPQGGPALSGATTLRVRYCECDPMGVAHHAAYAPWLEMSRTELLRSRGLTYAAMEAQGAFLVVTKLLVNYRRPVRYDDLLEVRVRLVPSTSRVKLEHEYDLVLIELGDAHTSATTINHSHTRHAGDILATAATTLACVDRDGRVCALPEWLAGRA